MTIAKHHNHKFLGGSPNIPESVGDRYYGQDLGRDFNFIRDQIGHVVKNILGGKTKVIASGGVVTQVGGQDKINVSAFVGHAPFNVTIPDSWASLPPSVVTGDIDLVEVIAPQILSFDLTTQSVPATLNGIAVNYIKISYAETGINSRTRVHGVGTYNAEDVPSYVLSVNTVAPTSYEICLGSLIGTSGGTGYAISTINRDYDLSNRVLNLNNNNSVVSYAISANETYSLYTITIVQATDFVISLPPVASSLGRKIKIMRLDNAPTRKVTIDPNASETINGTTLQYLSSYYDYIEMICDGTEWKVIDRNPQYAIRLQGTIGITNNYYLGLGTILGILAFLSGVFGTFPIPLGATNKSIAIRGQLIWTDGADNYKAELALVVSTNSSVQVVFNPSCIIKNGSAVAFASGLWYMRIVNSSGTYRIDIDESPVFSSSTYSVTNPVMGTCFISFV